MPAPSVRAMRSVPPPGANGTTRRMGLSGNAASAVVTASAVVAIKAPRRAKLERKNACTGLSPAAVRLVVRLRRAEDHPTAIDVQSLGGILETDTEQFPTGG